jgi:hypothetical protein
MNPELQEVLEQLRQLENNAGVGQDQQTAGQGKDILEASQEGKKIKISSMKADQSQFEEAITDTLDRQ